MAGISMAQEQAPPPLSPSDAAKPQRPRAADRKLSGVERQKSSVTRQIGDANEMGWLLRPWPKTEPPAMPPAAPPAITTQ